MLFSVILPYLPLFSRKITQSPSTPVTTFQLIENQRTTVTGNLKPSLHSCHLNQHPQSKQGFSIHKTLNDRKKTYQSFIVSQNLHCSFRKLRFSLQKPRFSFQKQKFSLHFTIESFCFRMQQKRKIRT